MLDRRFSVAPMMECTDRFYRTMARILSRRALLYTEMITTGAALRGDRARLLGFDAFERPVALQLGGADPAAMAEAARLAEDLGYDEVNINCGCPSDRVQAGRFGACLMAEPDTVAACVAAMRRAVSIPVTVKTRIGIDDRDSYEHLVDFVRRVADAGCDVFVVHARKAWLQGLSPKQNREIPPLRYETVLRLKADFPQLAIVLNGGLKSVDEAAAYIGPDGLDGVMLGRAAYDTPYILADIDRRLFGDPRPVPTRADVVEAYLPYVERMRGEGVPLAPLAKPLIPLFHGQAGGRLWRRHLAEQVHRRGAGPEVLREGLAIVAAAEAKAAAT
ncbi:MAG: tRNA dihydrouridine(20/20a) synthase DusA, partial [Rhodospirillaceae bacterium]|nr:tRNA dihydrouridine(20/20a) synthase DusA [Rhodospirillaceae bacterium]